MNKIIKFCFSRVCVVGLALVLQVIWFIIFFIQLGNYYTIMKTIFNIISILVVLWIINKNENPAYKLAWIIPILLFPFFGGVLYILMGGKKPSRNLRDKLNKVIKENSDCLRQDNNILKEIEMQDEHIANQIKYLINTVNFPIYKNTETIYFKSGEDNYKLMLEELSKARHYIFLEYFIIGNGVMWQGILDILEQKVKQGVDVRLIYDDVGCVTLLPYKYNKILEKKGIKAIPFNPYVPIFSFVMNHRDHRKIMVIDGYIAFTGGINIADEYINEKERFGYWKDTGIMLKGDAAWSFTMMFLDTWNGLRPMDRNFNVFRPSYHYSGIFESDGYVQPYGDTPLDEEIVGENVYLNIINSARKYVYIVTPYLIIDNEMMTCLCIAAKKGIDIRIITPGIPDKVFAFWLTQSYYNQLISSGVKIYQYTPGFVHAKMFVSDDIIATIGSINMDYRSLYLHFECGTFLYKTKTVMDIKNDILDTINISRKIERKDCKKGLLKKLVQAVLRVFAPLM